MTGRQLMADSIARFSNSIMEHDRRVRCERTAG
jgi:hypothetical protein